MQVDCYLCGKQVAAFRAHMKIHLKEERQQLVKMLEETKMFPVITVTVSIQLLLDTSFSGYLFLSFSGYLSLDISFVKAEEAAAAIEVVKKATAPVAMGADVDQQKTV